MRMEPLDSTPGRLFLSAMGAFLDSAREMAAHDTFGRVSKGIRLSELEDILNHFHASELKPSR